MYRTVYLAPNTFIHLTVIIPVLLILLFFMDLKLDLELALDGGADILTTGDKGRFNVRCS